MKFDFKELVLSLTFGAMLGMLVMLFVMGESDRERSKDFPPPEISRTSTLNGKPVVYDETNPRYVQAVSNGKQVGIFDKELGKVAYFNP